MNNVSAFTNIYGTVDALPRKCLDRLKMSATKLIVQKMKPYACSMFSKPFYEATAGGRYTQRITLVSDKTPLKLLCLAQKIKTIGGSEIEKFRITSPYIYSRCGNEWHFNKLTVWIKKL